MILPELSTILESEVPAKDRNDETIQKNITDILNVEKMVKFNQDLYKTLYKNNLDSPKVIHPVIMMNAVDHAVHHHHGKKRRKKK